MPKKLLPANDVVARIGLSKPTIYRLMNAGEFPRPVRLSPNRVAWCAEDVDTWIENRPTAEGI